jgi:hypothetical protein
MTTLGQYHQGIKDGGRGEWADVSALEKARQDWARVSVAPPTDRSHAIFTKNPAEKELDRLGFKRSEILPGLSDPRADRLAAKYMGPLVEKVIGQIATASSWQDRTDAEKGIILQGVLRRLRQSAISQARAEAPELFGRLKYEDRPKRQRALLEEQMQWEASTANRSAVGL